MPTMYDNHTALWSQNVKWAYTLFWLCTARRRRSTEFPKHSPCHQRLQIVLVPKGHARVTHSMTSLGIQARSKHLISWPTARSTSGGDEGIQSPDRCLRYWPGVEPALRQRWLSAGIAVPRDLSGVTLLGLERLCRNRGAPPSSGITQTPI